MRSLISIVLAVSFTGLAAAALMSQDEAPDGAAGGGRDAAERYLEIPLAARDAQKRAEAMTISIARAIEIAETETGGRATSAKARLTGEPVIEVTVVTAEVEERLSIDPSSGAIVDRASHTLPGEAPPPEVEVVELPSGLLYYDLREGDGPTPSGSTAVVKVHYTGWFVDGRKFDSSVDRGMPAEFQLRMVIPGWTTGVGSMKVGGKRKLIIPADLGYGDGRGDREGNVVIPSFATLIFDVELLEIVSDGE